MTELQASLTAAEFAEWMAYYRLEPWGEDRADLRTGILASTLANVHRGKRSKPYKPEDFMPRYDRPRARQQSASEIRNVFRFLTKSVNAA